MYGYTVFNPNRSESNSCRPDKNLWWSGWYTLLDSAIHYPQAMFEGQYLHLDIYHMAAGYLYSIVKNHPFIDGNKRTGFVTALLFLAYNDVIIEAKHHELYNLVIAVAEAKILEKDVALFFEQHSVYHF